MTAALGPYWHARGHDREAQAWYTRALAEATDGPPQLRARVLWASAYQALYAEEMELALRTRRAALELARECGDERTIARALDTHATMRQFSDPVGTQPDFLEAAGSPSAPATCGVRPTRCRRPRTATSTATAGPRRSPSRPTPA